MKKYILPVIIIILIVLGIVIFRNTSKTNQGVKDNEEINMVYNSNEDNNTEILDNYKETIVDVEINDIDEEFEE